MLKRISCVALGAILTSLVSSVGPTYAATIRSGSFNTFNATDSFSLGSQPAGLGDVNFGIDTPGLISQGTGTGTDNDSDLEEAGVILLFGAILAIAFLEGGGSESEEIPTPALLPGLIGMGMAAIRKKRGLPQTD